MTHTPGFLQLVNEARPRIREISLDAARARLQQNPRAVLVDVREDNEWAAGHLPGAIHLGKGIIERDIERTIPDRNAAIVCQCGGGFRSALVCENLQRMGYTNTLSLDGGFKGWVAKGLPLVKP